MEKDGNETDHWHYKNVSVDAKHVIFDSELYSMVVPSIFFSVFVVGSLGNVTAVYILQKLSRKRNISDIFVLNLACADLLFLSVLPFWSTEFALHGNWIFGSIFCKIASVLTITSAYASVFFLSLMSLDRLTGVVFYKKCKKYRTPKTAWSSVVVGWIFAAACSVLAFCFRGEAVNIKTGHRHCQWTFDHNDENEQSWFCLHVMLRLIFGFSLPVTLMAVSYIIIGCFLNKNRSCKQRFRNKQIRLTKLFFVIVVAFLICWLPNEISTLIYMVEKVQKYNYTTITHYYVHIFTNCLAWAHSAINPFLYGFMRDDFRIKLAEIQARLSINVHRHKRSNQYAQKEVILQENNEKLIRKGDNLQLPDIGISRTPSQSSFIKTSKSFV